MKKKLYLLLEMGHDINLCFEKQVNLGRDDKRKRNVILFNPPFNMQVRTCPVCRNYLTATIKVSYSYTSNLDNIIKRLNKGNLNLEVDVRSENKVLCKCRRKNKCPLNGIVAKNV